MEASTKILPLKYQGSQPDAGSAGEEQWPAGSLSNGASQAGPVRAVGAKSKGRLKY